MGTVGRPFPKMPGIDSAIETSDQGSGCRIPRGSSPVALVPPQGQNYGPPPQGQGYGPPPQGAEYGPPPGNESYAGGPPPQYSAKWCANHPHKCRKLQKMQAGSYGPPPGEGQENGPPPDEGSPPPRQ
jgi:hypothetical protein